MCVATNRAGILLAIMLPGHDLAHFNFLPFEKVRSTDPFVIEARESYWIEKYRVLEEGGMNRRR